MTWNPKDLLTAPDVTITAVPQRDKMLPITTEHPAMPSHDLLIHELAMSDHEPSMIPMQWERDYEAAGFVPLNKWRRWTRLVTRGIHSVE